MTLQNFACLQTTSDRVLVNFPDGLTSSYVTSDKVGPATPEKSEHTLPFTIMTLARHVALPWCTTILAEYPFLLVHIPRLYGPDDANGVEIIKTTR